MRHRENADRFGGVTLWDHPHREAWLSEHPDVTITVTRNGPYIVKGAVPVAEQHIAASPVGPG